MSPKGVVVDRPQPFSVRGYPMSTFADAVVRLLAFSVTPVLTWGRKSAEVVGKLPRRLAPKNTTDRARVLACGRSSGNRGQPPLLRLSIQHALHGRRRPRATARHAHAP